MFPLRICLFCRQSQTNNRLILLKNYAGASSTNANKNDKEFPRSTGGGDDVIPKSEIDPVSGLPFRKLELIPVKKTDDVYVDQLIRPYDRVLPKPRAERMSTTQDWASVWPTAHSFKASVVPLPIRMGFQQKLKPPPVKTANLELMKIPNFLHLTPPAIRRHCEAIKKFCTPWPDELTTDEKGETLRRHYFPIEIVACDYVHSGPSIRDARSRIVTLHVKVDDLPLGEKESRARQKFIKLCGDRYDKKTDMVSIVTDRCPVRHQNKDYAMYLLAVLFHEAWKEEPWESEIAAEDKHKWFWQESKSEEVVFDTVKRLKTAYESAKAQDSATAKETLQTMKHLLTQYPEFVRQAKTDLSKDDLLKMAPIKRYVELWDQYRNNPETIENTNAYGETVRALFGLPSPPKD